jgi:O-antigen/teichoic acid export membrane protein
MRGAHHKDVGLLKRVLNNSFALMTGRVVDITFSLLALAIVARYLGTNHFGRYAFIMAVGSLITPLVDMGLRRILIREMAKDMDNAEEYLGSALFLRGVVTVFLVLASIILILLSGSETIYLIVLVALSKLVLTYEMVFTGVFNAFERMGYEAMMTASRKLSYLVLLLLVVFMDLKLMGIIMVSLVSNVLGASFGYLVSRKRFIVSKLKVSWNRCVALLKEAYPLGIYAFILVLFYRIDIFFLKYYRDTYEIGLYQAASQFILMGNIIPMALVSSLFPSFSRFADMDRQRFASVYKKAFKYLLILGLAIVLTILYLAEEIVLLVYGRDFLDASFAMRILAWILLVVFFNVLLSTILTAVNRQVFNAIAAAACLSINIVMDIILIPTYGYIGACYATLISFLVLFLMTFCFVNRFVVQVDLVKLLWKPVISVTVPIFILTLVKASPVIFVLPSLTVYFALLFLFKVISNDDLASFKRIFSRG